MKATNQHTMQHTHTQILIWENPFARLCTLRYITHSLTYWSYVWLKWLKAIQFTFTQEKMQSLIDVGCWLKYINLCVYAVFGLFERIRLWRILPIPRILSYVGLCFLFLSLSLFHLLPMLMINSCSPNRYCRQISRIRVISIINWLTTSTPCQFYEYVWPYSFALSMHTHKKVNHSLPSPLLPTVLLTDWYPKC